MYIEQQPWPKKTDFGETDLCAAATEASGAVAAEAGSFMDMVSFGCIT